MGCKYPCRFLPFKNKTLCFPCHNFAPRAGVDSKVLTEQLQTKEGLAKYVEKRLAYCEDYKKHNPVGGQPTRIPKSRDFSIRFQNIERRNALVFKQQKDFGVFWPENVLKESKNWDLFKEPGAYDKAKQKIFDEAEQTWKTGVILGSDKGCDPNCIRLFNEASAGFTKTVDVMNSVSASREAVDKYWGTLRGAQSTASAEASETTPSFKLQVVSSGATVPTAIQDSESEAESQMDVDYLSGLIGEGAASAGG